MVRGGEIDAAREEESSAGLSGRSYSSAELDLRHLSRCVCSIVESTWFQREGLFRLLRRLPDAQESCRGSAAAESSICQIYSH